jgi:hypothetical protein
MQRLACLLAVVLLAPAAPLVCPAAALAQEHPDLAPNAALHYWRVWQTRGFQTDEGKKLSEMAGAQYQISDASWVPDEALTKALVSQQEFVDGLINASKLEGCDWGVAYDEGINALLPHLGLLRSSARILGSDARRLLVAGKPDEAAGRVAAMFRVAAHARTDQVMISSLVSVAVAVAAADETQVLASSGKLTEAGRAEILLALSRFDATDPFQMKASIDTERRIFLVWIGTTAKGPTAGADLIKTMGTFEGPDNHYNDSPVKSMDESALRKAVADASPFYYDVAAIWDQPDAAARLKVITDRLEKGEYGELAKLVVPAVGRAFKTTIKGQARIAATIGLLKGTVPADPRSQPAK